MAIPIARGFTNVSERDIDIIIHSTKRCCSTKVRSGSCNSNLRAPLIYQWVPSTYATHQVLYPRYPEGSSPVLITEMMP